MTADALPTTQIDGVAWNLGIAGNKVYAGGEFTRARPAGANPGQNEVVRNNLRPADPHHHEVPQVNLPPIEARWFSLGRIDGATVTTADGRGVVYRKRDRDKAVELAKESARLQKEVAARFDEMRQRYRVAHSELTSAEAWGRIFEPESVVE